VNLSCIWIESETSKCKTRKKSCSEINESKEWCETQGCVEDDILCIWLEGNKDMEEDTKCIDEV
jgi:hypothetical protein